MLVRTTLRLKENIKRSAEKKAHEDNTTLQDIFNRALEEYLEKDAKNRPLLNYPVVHLSCGF